ncbi:MAG: hypothetical protein NTZ05_22080 [Chloroflexi bacterium]|nr:hypothetical protein [Chloroflexota bacterium]
MAGAVVQVPGGSVRTVQVDMPLGATIIGSFNAPDDITFTVVDPRGNYAYNPGRVRGRWNFEVFAVIGGTHTLTFDNRHSQAPKQLTLDYRVR